MEQHDRGSPAYWLLLVAMLLLAFGFVPVVYALYHHPKLTCQSYLSTTCLLQLMGYATLTVGFALNPLKWEFAIISGFDVCVLLALLICKLRHWSDPPLPRLHPKVRAWP